MQINENQKAVSKSLKNDLNADLLYYSDDIKERILALKLLIAKNLGEDPESPLYGRIILGENPKDGKRCVTTETIKLGLDRSNFFGEFVKNSIKVDGTFYKGNNDNTFSILMPFLSESFDIIKSALPSEWSKGEENDGYLAINAGVESLIRIFSDIIDHLIKGSEINPKSDKTETLIEASRFYLDPMIDYLKNLTQEQKLELKRSYGTGLKTKYWRTLQKSINAVRTDFQPEGLSQYWRDEAKQFNEESFRIIRDIETSLKTEFKENLIKQFGKDHWFKRGVPPQVQDAAVLLAAQKNREVEDLTDEVTPWDCLSIIDYRRIAIYGSNWKDVFEKRYTKPGEERISGGKEEKTKWLEKLNKIRNQNFHSYSVKHDEYEFLTELYDWLIREKIETYY